MVCFTFMVLVSALFLLIRSLILPRTALEAENLALRQQLAVLNRKIHRPQLHRRDRFFWVILCQLWKNRREVLIILKPETVIKWHRQGFKLYWRWKSKAPVGRPKIDKEIRELIRKMSRENPLWDVPSIQAELRLLGLDLAESTVAKYRIRGGASPSQTCRPLLPAEIHDRCSSAAIPRGAAIFIDTYYFHAFSTPRLYV
jgi:putative transposase